MSKKKRRNRRGNGSIHPMPDVSGFRRLPSVNGDGPAKPVGVAVPLTPPKPPDPNLQFAQSWRGTYGEFVPTVSEAAYHQFIEMLLQEHQIEIAGIFHLDEAHNTIDWFWRDQSSKGSGGGVHSDDGPGIVQAMLAGVGIPNGQWHTHPGFGTYWSGTDLTDQGATVRAAMSVAANGTTYFIVANALNWRVRKVAWNDGKITEVADGHVLRWDGYVLDYADKGRSFTAINPYPYGMGRQPSPVVARPADEVAEGYGDFDDDGYRRYWQRHKATESEHPLLLPAPALKQAASVWIVPGVDYGPLFAKYGLEEGEWDFLETSINRQYPGLFPQVMAAPEMWPEL